MASKLRDMPQHSPISVGARCGFRQKFYEKYENGDRLTRTATTTDHEGRFSASSTVVVAVVVNRNGQESGGEDRETDNPLQRE